MEMIWKDGNVASNLDRMPNSPEIILTASVPKKICKDGRIWGMPPENTF